MLDYIKDRYIQIQTEIDYSAAWNNKDLKTVEAEVIELVNNRGIRELVSLYIYYDITEKEDGTLICQKSLCYSAEDFEVYDTGIYQIDIQFKDGHFIVDKPEDHEKDFAYFVQIDAYLKESHSYDFRNVIEDFHLLSVARIKDIVGLKIDIYNVIDDDNHEDCIQYEQHTLKEITDMLAEINLKRNFKYF